MAESCGPGKRCIGFGDREGICENEATANPPTLLWCAECEAMRIESIDRDMELVTALFDEEPDRA